MLTAELFVKMHALPHLVDRMHLHHILTRSEFISQSGIAEQTELQIPAALRK